MGEDKKYQSFKLPERSESRVGRVVGEVDKTAPEKATDSDGFYEIEYDAHPIKGVGKFVAKTEKIKPPKIEKDEVRELFFRMREIAREHRMSYANYRYFFDRKSYSDNSEIFYKQAVFMQDFDDDFSQVVPFSSYFPNYQMLGYDQLRTYFTWRTAVRRGVVEYTSLSYAFMYMYELICLVGVKNAEDGLNALMSFWSDFRTYDNTVDKYVINWIKDFHIYYKLPCTFKSFIIKHDLTEVYPNIIDYENDFSLYCAISKYDVKKSIFFTDDRKNLVENCFFYVLDKIKKAYSSVHIDFDEVFFRSSKKVVTWKPFKDTMFYSPEKLPDRRIVLSLTDLYVCRNGEWTYSSYITTDKGKKFIGYVMKKTESMLRILTKYRKKLSADVKLIDVHTLDVLVKFGLDIEKIVTDAVSDFYREETKTVVVVDHQSLDKIRRDALLTQEALIVEEQPQIIESPLDLAEKQSVFEDFAKAVSTPVGDEWSTLKETLSEVEIKALSVVLDGGDIRGFANENKVMLEVLFDGINEKSMDTVGDNLTDDEFFIYDDYTEKVRELVK